MVSAIITTYNRSSFLRDAVASVLSQGLTDMEVIVIDDGSTDDSYKAIEGMPVRYIWKQNGGISSARNRGIIESRGDYIAFLDVDDLWLKGKVQEQVSRMEAEGWAVSYTDEIWIKNGKRINQRLRHKKYSGWIFEYCLPLCIISPSSVLIRRMIFEDVGLFDEAMPVCEDYDMWLRITSRCPVLFIERPFIIKRGGHTDQLSRRYEAMDRFRICSIAKLLSSGKLKGSMTVLAQNELKKKAKVYIKGAFKRGKVEEAGYYLRLIEALGHIDIRSQGCQPHRSFLPTD